MMRWLRKLVAVLSRDRSSRAQMDLVTDALESGDYQTVFTETEKIIAHCESPARLFTQSGRKMFFNSSEEYNNYLVRHPGRSFIPWEFPVGPEAHFQRALAYEGAGRLHSSRAEIERSLRDFPTSAKYLAELGYVLLEMTYFKEAKERFLEAAAHDLTSSRQYEALARQGLGLVALEEGDFLAARYSFLDSWRLAGSSRELIAYLQLLSEIERDPRQRAEFYLTRGNWELALRAFRKALACNSDDFEMHLGIAYVLKELQKPGQAERHIKRAFRCNPESSEVNFALAWIHTLQKRYAAAEAEFHKAIAKNRYDPGYFLGLAIMYLEQIRDGDNTITAKMMAALNRATELDDAYPDPYLIKAEYYFQISELSKALRAVHRAIKLAPATQAGHVLASEIYLEMGIRKRSLHHLEEAADFGRDTDQMRALRSRLQDDVN